MSADNGVYILKTKDQYRVSHFGAIGNLYYSHLQEKGEQVSCLEVVIQYGDKKFTRKKGIALYIASKILEGLPVCEYGINFIKVNKTWQQISIEAQREAQEIIKGDINYYGDKGKLKEVANGG